MNDATHKVLNDRNGACLALALCLVLGALPATSRAQGKETAPTVPAPRSGTVPEIHVAGHEFMDDKGKPVVLRGVASMGMAMVYGDRDAPGRGLSVAQYVDRATQTDASGNRWYSNAIRLSFERFPSVNPQRLYANENMPYAMPDTIAFPAWRESHAYGDGEVAASGGSRYQVARKMWRADRGLPWNPSPYRAGEVVVNADGDVYRCVSSQGNGAPAGDWGAYPKGHGEAIPENQGALQYVWRYIGPFGASGTTPLSQLPTVTDNGRRYVTDNLVQWQYLSPDYAPARALSNFNDWASKVMNPAIARAVANKLYVVITDFDFGPAHHPLRHARMLDFWTRMAASRWANHPNVVFELWNESEDIGPFAGGRDSWAAQKPAIQETVDAIRAAGAQNIIIVPTPFYGSWAAEATANPLTGINLAYAIHQYRSTWEMYPANRAQITAAMSSGLAVVFTEWGDDTNPATPELAWPTTSREEPSLQTLLESTDAQRRPAAGWFAWSLSQSWAPGMFTDDELRRPNPFGAAVRQWLSDRRPDATAAK